MKKSRQLPKVEPLGADEVRALLAPVESEKQVQLAVSGGADSLALAAAASNIQAETSLSFFAVVIDHGLQPESAAIAQEAAERCADLGLSHVRVVAVEVDTTHGEIGRAHV